MTLNAPVGYFEIYKDFVDYGEGSMLCYYDGKVLHYVQFGNDYRRVVINKELFDQYKKNLYSSVEN